jgi:hypothetical protein
LAAGLLAAPAAVYAACGLDGIPEQYRPLDLSEGTTNTMGEPVIGGEAASTRAERECREEQKRQSWYQTSGMATNWDTETLYDGIKDQFISGGNSAYDILSSIGRATENPYDPSFSPREWISKNKQKYGIEDQYMSTLMGAGSEGEAKAIVDNVAQRKLAQQRIQRMGNLGQSFTRTIAALPDIAIVLCGLAMLLIPVRSVFRRTSMEMPRRATASN